MKNIYIKSLLLISMFSIAYTVIGRELTINIAEPFSQVVISDGIDLVLDEGDKQQMSLKYFNVSQEDIIIEVKGKKLKIYLKGCKRGCKPNMYPDADVKVHLVYKTIEKLVVMGDNEVQHLSTIGGKKFTLKCYGDNRINFNEIHAKKLKTSLFGDNELHVEGGEIEKLKIKAFGDHRIELSQLACANGKVHAFGDSSFDLQVHHQLNVTMFGDASIRCEGNPWVDKKIVLGDLSLQVHN